MFTRRKSALVVLTVLLMGLAGACGFGSDDESSADGGDGGGLSEEVDNLGAPTQREPAFDTAAGQGGDDPIFTTDSNLPGTPPRVIKTADIRVAVPKDEFRESVQSSVDVAERNGGFVNSTALDDDANTGSVTIRVPSERFEATLGELKEIGDVEGETISGTDVSQEFVDLEARKRNLEAQEAVLLDLMQEATTIDGTIRVQRELTPIQLEIERIQGRINYLSDQTDMSTITVTFTQAGAAPPEPANVFERSWDNARSISLAVGSAIVMGAGFVLPIALLVAVIALVVRWLRPLFTA